MTTGRLPVPRSAPRVSSPLAPPQLCVPQGMLSLSPAEMLSLSPAGTLSLSPTGMLSLSLQGCSVLGQQGLVAVGPSHTLPRLQQFLDPQDKLYLPKGQTEMARRPGKASRRTEHLTVICLTKFYRLLCLTPGYGRNTGKREGWEWKQRGVLKTSKTRWD